jgi:CHASE3 domain sensor protein
MQYPLLLASNVALAPNSSNARRENYDKAVFQKKSHLPLARGLDGHLVTTKKMATWRLKTEEEACSSRRNTRSSVATQVAGVVAQERLRLPW